LASAYEKATGIKVNYDVVSVGSLLTRVTTAAENNSGPDLTTVGFNWAFLFDEKLVDVSDIAAEVGKGVGRLVRVGAGSRSSQRQVEGDPVRQHRPADELAHRPGSRRRVTRNSPTHGMSSSRRHQAQGRRAIRSASSSATAFGDITAGSIRSCGPMAGGEVEADGKTIVIDSDETARAVDFCRKFFQQTMFEDCLGWTDVSNNKAFLSEQISCNQQRRVDPVAAKKDFPEWPR